MKKDQVWYCVCGTKVFISQDDVESEDFFCPQCGSPISSLLSISTADTQTVNIEEMARMAQEGVDEAVSGEWDTTEKAERITRNSKK